MAVFSYRCRACDGEFDAERPRPDRNRPIDCPFCRSDKTQRAYNFSVGRKSAATEEPPRGIIGIDASGLAGGVVLRRSAIVGADVGVELGPGGRLDSSDSAYIGNRIAVRGGKGSRIRSRGDRFQ